MHQSSVCVGSNLWSKATVQPWLSRGKDSVPSLTAGEFNITNEIEGELQEWISLFFCDK